MKLETASIHDLSQALASRELSATELTTHFLNRIDARSDLNAFISVEHDLHSNLLPKQIEGFARVIKRLCLAYRSQRKTCFAQRVD